MDGDEVALRYRGSLRRIWSHYWCNLRIRKGGRHPSDHSRSRGWTFQLNNCEKALHSQFWLTSSGVSALLDRDPRVSPADVVAHRAIWSRGRRTGADSGRAVERYMGSVEATENPALEPARDRAVES